MTRSLLSPTGSSLQHAAHKQPEGVFLACSCYRALAHFCASCFQVLPAVLCSARSWLSPAALPRPATALWLLRAMADRHTKIAVHWLAQTSAVKHLLVCSGPVHAVLSVPCRCCCGIAHPMVAALCFFVPRRPPTALCNHTKQACITVLV